MRHLAPVPAFRQRGLARALKSLDSVFHVERVAGLALLTVVYDVDPCIQLPGYHLFDGFVDA